MKVQGRCAKEFFIISQKVNNEITRVLCQIILYYYLKIEEYKTEWCQIILDY